MAAIREYDQAGFAGERFVQDPASAGDIAATNANVSSLTTSVAGKVDGLAGVKVYRALLTNAGVSAPTVIVLENSLSATIVWTRTGIGVYLGTLTGAFTASKTFILIGNSSGNSGDGVIFDIIGSTHTSANAVTLVTSYFSAGVAARSDALLSGTQIEISVYP